ncbi:MAG: hypothetical protein AABX65_03040 [Nanoarchaeota archaeon]
MTSQKQLVLFIKEAKRRGLSEEWIRRELIDNGWKAQVVESALEFLKKEKKNLYGITIYLQPEVIEKVEKRARKNLMNVREQIEDIVRRSAVNASGKTLKEEKLDDTLVALFSRSRRGRR